MKKCCIVLLTICCILLTTACNDKSTVNTDTKNTSSVSSEVVGSKPTHQHSYISTVTKEATCASSGTKKYHCSCGHSYTETIAKTSHNYSSATCTSAKKCTLCGSTSDDALGHNYSNGYCTRCNSAEPTPQKTLNIPSLPLSLKSISGSGETYSIVKITDIYYEFDESNPVKINDSVRLNIYFTGEKTYDWERDYGNEAIGATLKVYDSEGYVVDNDTLFVQELNVGEKFRNEKVTFFIPHDCTSLTLEITNFG